MAFVLLVGGIFLAYGNYNINGEKALLAAHGKVTTAKIDQVEWKTKQGLDRDYVLTVDFTPEGGNPIKHKLSVDAETGRAAHDDKIDSLDVKYLPENPDIVYPADVGGPDNLGYVIGALTSLVGAVMIFLRLRKPKIGPVSA